MIYVAVAVYWNQAAPSHAFVEFPWYLAEHRNLTWEASAVAVTLEQLLGN